MLKLLKSPVDWIHGKRMFARWLDVRRLNVRQLTQKSALQSKTFRMNVSQKSSRDWIFDSKSLHSWLLRIFDSFSNVSSTVENIQNALLKCQIYSRIQGGEDALPCNANPIILQSSLLKVDSSRCVVCCSVLQCVAANFRGKCVVCCSVLQCVAANLLRTRARNLLVEMCSVLQRVALCFENCCSVLLTFKIVVSKVSCNTLQHTTQLDFENRLVKMCSVLQLQLTFEENI